MSVQLILPDERRATYANNESAARALAAMYEEGFTGIAAGCRAPELTLEDQLIITCRAIELRTQSFAE